MKIAVILENTPDCELERVEFEIARGREHTAEDKIGEIIDGWVLSVGDTIRIVEVPAKSNDERMRHQFLEAGMEP